MVEERERREREDIVSTMKRKVTCSGYRVIYSTKPHELDAPGWVVSGQKLYDTVKEALEHFNTLINQDDIERAEIRMPVSYMESATHGTRSYREWFVIAHYNRKHSVFEHGCTSPSYWSANLGMHPGICFRYYDAEGSQQYHIAPDYELAKEIRKVATITETSKKTKKSANVDEIAK